MKKILLTLLVVACTTLSAQVTITMEQEAGVYKVPCVVNGAKMKFIFDTGAATVCLSESMAEYLLDNDYLSKEDFVGIGTSMVADGRKVNNVQVILKDIEIGGLHLKNVEASVVEGQRAPLLLGQTAIQKLGRVSIERNLLIIERGREEICYPDIEGFSGTFSQLKILASKEIDSDTYHYTTLLADCYYFGNCVDVDKKEAIRWFKIGAKKGDAYAQTALGNMYLDGDGCTQDYSECVYWYEQAAERESIIAMCNLGYCYLNGYGVKKNRYSAFYWYSQADKDGKLEAASKSIAMLLNDFEIYAKTDEYAAYQLGMYYYLWGRKHNLQEAIKWLRKSVALDGVDALSPLGRIYKEIGDEQQAYYYFMRGVEKQQTESMNALAYAYANGTLGLKQNQDAAMRMIEMAISVEPEEANWYDSKGEIYYIFKNYQKAKEMWLKVKSINPDFYTKYDTELNKYINKQLNK